MSIRHTDSKKSKISTENKGLEIGTVLKLYVADITPPKEKRFIIVGITKDCLHIAYIFINSIL